METKNKTEEKTPTTQRIKLIYLGQELDSSKEHELFSQNEFGFKVTVKFKKESWMSQHERKQVVEINNNCTEVHYMYKGRIVKNEYRIAFESDIHQTGRTHDINDIESVVIELATQKEIEF